MDREEDRDRKDEKVEDDPNYKLVDILSTGKVEVSDGSGDLDDEMTVVTTPWFDKPLVGSIKATCERCLDEVCLSPSTQEILMRRRGRTHILCVGCTVLAISEESSEPSESNNR